MTANFSNNIVVIKIEICLKTKQMCVKNPCNSFVMITVSGF